MATLDFSGLHTACICGANGAGKSSLLEGMTWALWGKSRASSDDDVIQTGAAHVRVDFTFAIAQVSYRVIRVKPRGRSAELQFQVQTQPNQFRSLSEKGLRATQEKVESVLKLDYDTFINSAYLRQGEADRFMSQPPKERKRVLANLLKLDQYETLASQAREAARQFKTNAEVLKERLAPSQALLAQRPQLETQQREFAEQIAALLATQQQTRQEREQLQAQVRDRDRQAEKCHWQQTQVQKFTKELERLRQEQTQWGEQQQVLQQRIAQADAIAQRYAQLQTWRQEQVKLAERMQADQAAREQRAAVQREITQAESELHLAIQRTETELQSLTRQEQEVQPLLAQADEIQAALTQLQTCRQELHHLETVQLQVAPLAQRRQTLKSAIAQAEAKFRANLEGLQRQREQLVTAKSRDAELRQQLRTVDAAVTSLENQQVYQDRVLEKEQAQMAAQERHQTRLQSLSQELQDVEQTWQLLQQAEAHCPLCEQPLSVDDRAQVLEKTQVKQEQIQSQIWVLREQIAACEHERTQLTQELAQLRIALQDYERLVRERGNLEAQLDRIVEIQEEIWTLDAQLEPMTRSLTTGEYALDLQTELQELESAIAQLGYDEQQHSLLRSRERSLHWAEIKFAKLADAQQRLQQLHSRRPELMAQLEQQRQDLAHLRQNSPLQQQLGAIDAQINTLAYDAQAHQTLIQHIQHAQSWEWDYHQLQEAQQQLPELTQKIQALATRLEEQERDRDIAAAELVQLQAQLQNLPDTRDRLQQLDNQLQAQEAQLDHYKIEQGKTVQRLTQLTELESELSQTQSRIQWFQGQYQVYNALTQAFGKNGIQALMIENVLPQLEAETNHLLARLTGNQLHVQFVTQKAGKTTRKTQKKQPPKMIDTLDILIADAQGTRPYETYSGGEAFRINFAIRLALAKLLAQRAGAALQMLIIDEGFGTQDAAGCERLIAAINAIAPDFACILTVTHMPQFKAAFQHRIEVQKTANGSALHLTS